MFEEEEMKRIRALVAKPGADGHWRGVLTVAKALAEAGMEVIFAGYQDLEDTIKTAIEEDVDVIGLSFHSGAHLGYAKVLMDLLEKEGVKDDFLVVFGGIIPDEDIPPLKKLGVAGVFGPGTDTSKIVKFIKEKVD